MVPGPMAQPGSEPGGPSSIITLSEAPHESALKFTSSDSKEAEALFECLTFPQLLEQDSGVRAEALDQNIGGDKALFVGDSGLRRLKTAEAALQIGQRNDHAQGLESARRECRIAWLEIACQAFVEPAGHSAVCQAAHHRMGQLVREHTIELWQVLRGALDRNANAPVEEAARPGRRVRDIAELPFAVERDGDAVRRVGADGVANSPVGRVEHVEPALAERAVH